MVTLAKKTCPLGPCGGPPVPSSGFEGIVSMKTNPVFFFLLFEMRLHSLNGLHVPFLPWPLLSLEWSSPVQSSECLSTVLGSVHVSFTE